MMKCNVFQSFQAIAILAFIFGAALEATARPQAPIPILSQTGVQDGSLQYNFGYQTGNGISAVEQGALKPNADRTDNIISKIVSTRHYIPRTNNDQKLLI